MSMSDAGEYTSRLTLHFYNHRILYEPQETRASIFRADADEFAIGLMPPLEQARAAPDSCY